MVHPLVTGAVVETTTGAVRGTRHGEVHAFRGIPYASAPRFLPPEPPTPWTGVREAAAFGPIPPQVVTTVIDSVMGVVGKPQDEECLSLNVWTPGCDDGRRPVLLWVYGGGFTSGGSGAPWYDGARLAQQGAVVVSCNYRVGALGFLHLAEVLGEPYEAAGNLGLLDLVAALQWVRDNVASFGGDPGRVTVFGESSGGAAAAFLTRMPSAQGLFRRAAVQSGGTYPLHAVDEADRVARLLLAELGLEPAEAKRLLDVPVADLLAAQQRVTAAYGAAQAVDPKPRHFRMAIQPVADGTVLGTEPCDAGVDLLAGSNVDEFTMVGRFSYPDGVTDEALEEHAARVFGHGDALAVYRAARPTASATDLLYAFEADHYFGVPALRLAERHPGLAWLYRFTLDGTGMGGPLGAGHALEIPFVFDNLHAPGVEEMLGPVTEEGRALATAMSAAWLRFAADGDPGWPRYEAESRPVLFWGATPAVAADPAREVRRLWDEVW